jgi:hypothetical protein
MSLRSVKKNIHKFSDIELSHFVSQIKNQKEYEYLAEEEELSQPEMDELMRFIVLKLMMKNLVIPHDGTAVDMLEMAEAMNDMPSFEGKYDGDGL